MEKSSRYETNAGGRTEVTGAAERTLDILEYLEASDEPQTLTHIVAALGLPKASVHRLLGTLRDRGYIAQPQARGGYTLGLRVLRLAARARERLDIASLAAPFLKRLATETGESCQISVRSGGQALCVARVASPLHPDVSLTGHVGSVFPLHAAAVGKVLLAYAPEEERSRYLAGLLTPYTPYTHTESQSLEFELGAVRLVGMANDREEYKRGLSALAAPIFDESGTVIAAIALPFLATAAEENQSLTDKMRALREAAQGISRTLGYSYAKE